jgi:RNA polymerase sigma-B factor
MAVTVPRGSFEAGSSDERARHTRDLLERWHARGDRRAREELVERFLPLARQLARRYHRGREPLDDLVQVASLGLIKAIDRFDLQRETAFSSYAVPIMLGELRRHFRDTGWGVHVPRGLQELVLRIERTTEDMRGQLGRSPRPTELAEALGLELEAVLEALGAVHAGSPLSLDATVSDDPDAESRVASIGGEDAGYDLVEYRSVMGTTLSALPERDRQVLQMRFVEGLTQAEIAERVGLSQMSISRMLRRITERLRLVATANAA